MDYGYGYTWPGPGRGPLPLSSCGCNQFPSQPCGPLFPPPGGGYGNGCPILLDTGCVIYGKNMNTPSGLTNLQLPNGSTLTLILNTIDPFIGQLNVPNWTLPILRSIYTINSLQVFGQSVDTEFGVILAQITTLSGLVNSPNTSTDTETIAFDLTGTLERNISASVKVSDVSGNTLTVQPDGLFAQAQNLSIDYTNKLLTITDGNTVDFSSLTSGTLGFLGNLSADPISIDGQYWYNTSSGTLKIKVNGAVRTIPIV